MHEYFKIKEAIEPILSAQGFTEESENIRPDVFGSIVSIFTRADERVRVVWDGKDGVGIFQIEDASDSWRDLLPYIPESTEAEMGQAIQELADRVRLELDGRT